MQVITPNSGDPSLFETPKKLGVHPPIVKCFCNRKRFVDATAGLETPIHQFRLPFHKRETAFRVRTFPFVKEVAAINLRPRIRARFIGAKSARRPDEHCLRVTQVERIFPARNPDQILQAAQFAISGPTSEKYSVLAGIAE